MMEHVKFLLILKKDFIRKILPYEVLLASLCCKVNGHTLIDSTLISNLINSESINDSHVLLELFDTKEKSAYSFSTLKKVWFATEESKAVFFERSYQNFDINSLDCNVIVKSKWSDIINSKDIVIESPQSIRQSNFINQMMFSDGALALLHSLLISNEIKLNNIINNLSHSKTDIDAIVTLIDIPSDTDLEEALKHNFALLCLKNGHNAGWDSSDILKQLLCIVHEEFEDNTVYLKWREIGLALLNNESVQELPFDDNGIIVLRAIILALLNPALENLDVLKSQKSFSIGERVYHAARSFILLRFGYSFFEKEKRFLENEKRNLLQDFNAALINNELTEFNSFYNDKTLQSKSINTDIATNNVHKETTETIKNINNEKNTLLELDYLSVDNNMKNKNISYEIIGLTPNAGFKLSLIENVHSQQISLWLIDLQTPHGAKKFKGKTATELLNIQSILNKGERFEIDDYGVYLRFPSEINDVKAMVLSALNKLSALSVYNVRKSTFR